MFPDIIAFCSIQLLMTSNFFIASINLRKTMYPLFWANISYSKLKFLVILFYHPSSPSISYTLLILFLNFFLSPIFQQRSEFQQRNEFKNSAQQFLISLQTALIRSRSGLFQLLVCPSIYQSIYNIQLSKTEMAPKKIWLDCDPGHDDMLAIIMAALSEEVQLLGISTSSGNSCIENTTQNALNILHQIGKANIEVVKGAAHPLCCKLETAPQIHGQSGLQGAQLQKSSKNAIEQKPFLHIYQRIMSQEEKIDFVVTGAMTNLAILLKAFPDIHEKIKAITVMGGAIGLGNWSPAAQFNILVDPEAANIVVASKIPITFIPLQVTHTVEVTEEIFAQINSLQSNFCKKLTPLFRYFQKSYKQNQNFQFPVAHDPCTIYYLLRPEDFVSRKAFVEIQLQGNSRGRTNFHFMQKGFNSTVCQKINVPHFWKLMLDCLRKIK